MLQVTEASRRATIPYLLAQSIETIHQRVAAYSDKPFTEVNLGRRWFKLDRG